MKNLAFLTLILFLLNSCSKEEQDCSQKVTCQRTFYTYFDCTPDDGEFDEVYENTYEVDPMSVCDTLDWKLEMARVDLQSYQNGNDKWKEFLNRYPTKCNCAQ